MIGEKIFETSQFIRSELKISTLERNKINEIVSLLSAYFGENKTLILEALYVYTLVEKITWLIKNKENSQNISFSITVCKILLEMLEK